VKKLKSKCGLRRFIDKHEHDMLIITKEENIGSKDSEENNGSEELKYCRNCYENIPFHTEYRLCTNNDTCDSGTYCVACYAGAYSVNIDDYAKSTLQMVIFDIGEKKFWFPLENKREFTKENVQALLDDVTSGKLKGE